MVHINLIHLNCGRKAVSEQVKHSLIMNTESWVHGFSGFGLRTLSGLRLTLYHNIKCIRAIFWIRPGRLARNIIDFQLTTDHGIADYYHYVAISVK